MYARFKNWQTNAKLLLSTIFSCYEVAYKKIIFHMNAFLYSQVFFFVVWIYHESVIAILVSSVISTIFPFSFRFILYYLLRLNAMHKNEIFLLFLSFLLFFWLYLQHTNRAENYPNGTIIRLFQWNVCTDFLHKLN